MLRPVSDPSVAQWVVESMTTFGQSVGSIVPNVFEAYARIFHPAGKGENVQWVAASWADIAEANGKANHPEMSFASLVPGYRFDDSGLNWRKGQEGLWDRPPAEGEIPEDLAAELVRVLTLHTATPHHCYFAYWSGWGDPTPMWPPPRTPEERHAQQREQHRYRTGEVFDGTPRTSRNQAAILSLPGRDYFLFDGPVDEVITGWDGLSGALGGDDIFRGLTEGHDIILGGRGDDIIVGRRGNDKIWGGQGNDIIYGSEGDDKLYGGSGRDEIHGGTGVNKIDGGSGNDGCANTDPKKKKEPKSPAPKNCERSRPKQAPKGTPLE